ncbi:MAG TPA: hypothetical protein VN932_01450 [Rhizomicrobium sp.]|nr:hypothetical protein [Rhizomicrobium sp.]
MNLRIVAFTIGALVLSFPGAAPAAPRDDVLDAMGKCAAVADDKARLACYDALSPRVKDALATPPADLAHEPTKDEQKSWFGFDMGALFGTGSNAKQTTPQQFGSETTPQAQAQQQTVAAEEIDSISAGVTDYSFTPFGKFIVFLNNGQIWRQSDGDSDAAHFKKVAIDNTVTISRGLVGGYNLQINDGNHIFKVTRVK